jgi:hypothetical protein
MKRQVCVAVLALLAAAALWAQSPQGWKLRVDRSMTAEDPDAAGSIKFTTKGSGFHAINPQAATYWNPANTATGNYTLKGAFTLVKSTGYDEYYGLMFGGAELDGAGQNYLYFMITDDGTWLLKRRTGASTQNVSPRTPNAAVKKPGANGMCTNALEVRVMADKVDLVINGAVVGSMPKTGALAKTDGVYGLRINHQLDVQVDGFALTKQ